MSVELSEKRSELLAEAVPGLKRVAVLTTASNFTATLEYKEMEAAARVLGAKLQILKALAVVYCGSAPYFTPIRQNSFDLMGIEDQPSRFCRITLLHCCTSPAALTQKTRLVPVVMQDCA